MLHRLDGTWYEVPGTRYWVFCLVPLILLCHNCGFSLTSSSVRVFVKFTFGCPRSGARGVHLYSVDVCEIDGDKKEIPSVLNTRRPFMAIGMSNSSFSLCS